MIYYIMEEELLKDFFDSILIITSLSLAITIAIILVVLYKINNKK
jgi:hypothetical protein